jgi:hypothetical protein
MDELLMFLTNCPLWDAEKDIEEASQKRKGCHGTAKKRHKCKHLQTNTII